MLLYVIVLCVYRPCKVGRYMGRERGGRMGSCSYKDQRWQQMVSKKGCTQNVRQCSRWTGSRKIRLRDSTISTRNTANTQTSIPWWSQFPARLRCANVRLWERALHLTQYSERGVVVTVRPKFDLESAYLSQVKINPSFSYWDTHELTIWVFDSDTR